MRKGEGFTPWQGWIDERGVKVSPYGEDGSIEEGEGFTL